jgi:hypothetical protein
LRIDADHRLLVRIGHDQSLSAARRKHAPHRVI